MVTGYILICLATYEKLTGDHRYNLDGALEFEITNNAHYNHNTDSIFDALMMNWDQSPYCLFPCEASILVLSSLGLCTRETDCFSQTGFTRDAIS
jgi:hypothetical protein